MAKKTEAQIKAAKARARAKKAAEAKKVAANGVRKSRNIKTNRGNKSGKSKA